MCRLIESIKVINGHFENIYFHNLRLNKARADLWNCRKEIDIAHEVAVPPEFCKGLYKCRILYSDEIEKVEFVPYRLPEIRSLKLIIDDDIVYNYKFEDRTRIASLFDQRHPCDDILIIKNGCLTDTSFCNVVLYDGENYYTPSTRLLSGAKRQLLLAEKKVFEKMIKATELHKFQSIYLVNAMIDLEDEVCIGIKNVFY